MEKSLGKISIVAADAGLRARVAAALAERAEIDFGTSPAEADVELRADMTEAEFARTVELLAKLAAARAELRRAADGARHWARLAEIDSLTELPNRRAWDDALAAALHEAADKQPLCLALVDLDDFKRVNDERGHPVGDQVLQALADGLRSAVRRGDVAARIGGDEFGLLLPQLAPEQAPAVLKRIRNAVAARLAERRLPAVTCSIGFAGRSPELPNAALLLAAADAALHAAKRAGRNRIEAAADLS
ncbi:MAG: hypothetical protein C0483_02555 [Pirellula sp.]|nr:hypothetical protein [Pirellula sp.]